MGETEIKILETRAFLEIIQMHLEIKDRVEAILVNGLNRIMKGIRETLMHHLIHLLVAIMIPLEIKVKIKKCSKDVTAPVPALNHHHSTSRITLEIIGTQSRQIKHLHLHHRHQDQMTITGPTEILEISPTDQMTEAMMEITLMTEDLTTEIEALEAEEVVMMMMIVGGDEMMTDQEEDHQREAEDRLKLSNQL